MKILTMVLGVALALPLLPGALSAQGTSAIGEGAKLYGENCMRCHSARSPAERTDRQWVTIVNHMRARANIRKSEAEAMIAFLQSTNRPEAGTLARRPDDEVEERANQVVIDLAAPALSPETRAAVRRFLASLEEPPPGR